MRHRIHLYLQLLALTLTLQTGCSSNPGEGELRDQINNQILRNSNGLIQLIEFKKTNGMQSNFGGVMQYTMEWVAVLEFTADCMWDPTNFEAILPPQGIDFLLHITKKQATKGSRVEVNGSTSFQKMENGWRAMGLASTAPAPAVAAAPPPVPGADRVTIVLDGDRDCGDSCVLTVSRGKSPTHFYRCSNDGLLALNICKEIFGSGQGMPNISGRTASLDLEKLKVSDVDFEIVGGYIHDH